MHNRITKSPRLSFLPYLDEFIEQYRREQLPSFRYEKMIELIESVSAAPQPVIREIFSGDKTYANACYKQLVPAGIHYLRCLYSDFLYRKCVSNEVLRCRGFIRVRSFLSSAEVNSVRAHLLELALEGRLVHELHPRQFPLPEIKLKVLNYMRDNYINWGGMYFCGAELIREETGIQSVPHTDTFHPTLKAWIALEKVGENKGPIHYVENSHKVDSPRLDLEQMKLTNGDLGDRGSFRFSSAEINNAHPGCKPVVLSLCPGELIVVNTRGIHFRGERKKGAYRLCAHASMRCSPFLLPQPVCSEWGAR
jgi:hypothetical protein